MKNISNTSCTDFTQYLIESSWIVFSGLTSPPQFSGRHSGGCLTWRCVVGVEVLLFWRRADEPAVRFALLGGNKQRPATFAGEIPLASASPIRAALHIVLLEQWQSHQKDSLGREKNATNIFCCCHSPIQSQTIYQSSLLGPPTTGRPRTPWAPSWTPPPPWSPPPEVCLNGGSECSAVYGSF